MGIATRQICGLKLTRRGKLEQTGNTMSEAFAKQLLNDKERERKAVISYKEENKKKREERKERDVAHGRSQGIVLANLSLNDQQKKDWCALDRKLLNKKEAVKKNMADKKRYEEESEGAILISSDYARICHRRVAEQNRKCEIAKRECQEAMITLVAKQADLAVCHAEKKYAKKHPYKSALKFLCDKKKKTKKINDYCQNAHRAFRNHRDSVQPLVMLEENLYDFEENLYDSEQNLYNSYEELN